MSSCEKCWSDAHRGPQVDTVEEYHRLIEERREHPCTPEEQAGPDALLCSACGRLTLHQWTRQCMVIGCARHDGGTHAAPAKETP
jgi:hypothetical protein